MKYVKTFEGFFDFFKSKPSEDDTIILEFIKRLEKVKDENPYKITKEIVVENNEGKLIRYKVIFDDAYLVSNGTLFKSHPDKFLAYLNINEEKVRIKCKEKYHKKLYDLIDNIYENDQERKRLNKLKSEINPMADLL